MIYNEFVDMPVWKKSIDLSEKIFNLSVLLPKSEDYGLTSQIRRAANSINANIAEGFGRKTSKDKSHFYIISRGSVLETQSHLIYGYKVGYFEKETVDRLINSYNEIIHELNKLIKSLNS